MSALRTSRFQLIMQSGMDISVVLCSAVPWDELRPPRGDAPEPLHISVPAPTREGASSCNQPLEIRSLSPDVLKHLSPASSHPLWPRFLDLLLSSLLHLTSSPISELEYASQALWPLYTATLPPHAEQDLLGKLYPDPEIPPEPLVLSVKLLTDLKHNLAVPLAVAAEELLTRRTGISGFKDRATRVVPGTPSRTPTRQPIEANLAGDMSTCTKFLVVAAYCASYNPVKTDLRLFGRLSADGTRRRGGGLRRAGYGKTRIGKVSHTSRKWSERRKGRSDEQVPQRLLGPKPFGLDRLLAIFASLYAEHAPRPEDLQPVLEDWSSDEEEDWALGSAAIAQKRAERVREREKERDERWEEEVDHLTMSISLWSLVRYPSTIRADSRYPNWRAKACSSACRPWIGWTISCCVARQSTRMSRRSQRI